MQYQDIQALLDQELGKGRCVFILDDEAKHSEFLGNHIAHQFGACICTCTSPAQMLAFIREQDAENSVYITDHELGVLTRGKSFLSDIIKPEFPHLRCIIRSNDEGLYDAGSYEGTPVVSKAGTMEKINSLLRAYFRSMLCKEHKVEAVPEAVLPSRPFPFVPTDYKRKSWIKVRDDLQKAFPDKPVTALLKHLKSHPDFSQKPQPEAIQAALDHVWRYLDTGKTAYAAYLTALHAPAPLPPVPNDQLHIDLLRASHSMKKPKLSHQGEPPKMHLKRIIHDTSIRAPEGLLPRIEDDSLYVRNLQNSLKNKGASYLAL